MGDAVVMLLREGTTPWLLIDVDTIDARMSG